MGCLEDAQQKGPSKQDTGAATADCRYRGFTRSACENHEQEMFVAQGIKVVQCGCFKLCVYAFPAGARACPLFGARALNVDAVESSAASEREGLQPKDRQQLLTIIPILQS